MSGSGQWTRRQLLGTVGPVALLANAQQVSQKGGRAVMVRAFDPSGSPAPDDRLLLVAPDSRPFEVLAQPHGDGTAAVDMPKEKFELKMFLPVRDFGEVYVHADNAGAWYSAAQVRGELLLNYEFARSRATFVRRYVKSAQTEGVEFSSAMMNRLEQGEAALVRAAAARETGARVGHSNDSLAETMWAGEMAAVERARHRIARQGPRPGFLFGSAAFGYARSEEYARQYGALLNYGTVPFYRAQVERVEGVPNYRNVEGILEKLAGTQIIAKGHPLVWFDSAAVPEFLTTKPWDELKRSCRDYILRSVGRFRSRIHAWDVINEAHDWANKLSLNQDQLLEMTRLAAESTRLADPTAFRVINCCMPWGEYVGTGRGPSGPLKRPLRTPLEYYRAIEAASVPYEAIGIQVYYPAYDLLEIERQLERFFAFGKSVHITELGVPSSSEGVKIGGTLPYDHVWHGAAWSEATQADWAEQFYTICYSKPAIQAISWWTFADPSRPANGLLHADLQPKQSYLRLAKLLTSWKQG
jgi:GH35 family endo-1,4-beta-xylanase